MKNIGKYLPWLIGAAVLFFAWKKGLLASLLKPSSSSANANTVNGNLGTRPVALPGSKGDVMNMTRSTAQTASDYVGLATTGISTIRGLFGGYSSSTGTRSPSTSGSGTGSPAPAGSSPSISQSEYDANTAWSEQNLQDSQDQIDLAYTDSQPGGWGDPPSDSQF
jgi:hypothetical protein